MITAEDAKALALALGFDRAGVAPAEPGPHAAFLREWLARGYDGEMAWIGRRAEERMDPRAVLPGARSVIAVALVYDPATPAPHGPVPAGRVARYAGGEDYHEVMWERLRALEAGLSALASAPIVTRSYCDTGPVQEREFAARAGLGWIGKNTCLIHPTLGSYVFLGVVLTDLDLGDGVAEPDHCGSCRACLDACPTDAFPEPYVLDATRCISYTTIESRGAIDPALRAAHGDWIFGCDVCQEVCPWNRRVRRAIPADRLGLRSRLQPRPEWVHPSLRWILDLDAERWREATHKTALRRSRHRGLLRNALVVAGNVGRGELIPRLRAIAACDDALLAEHARWALDRMAERGEREPG